MRTVHRLRHVKAAVRVAGKDEEQWSLMQLRVTDRIVEASDGHKFIRIERDDAPEGQSYRSAASAAACRDVCKGSGVEQIEFNGETVVGLGETPDDGSRGPEIVIAPIGEIQECLPMDHAIPRLTKTHRTISVSPKLLADTLAAMVAAGARQVTLAVPDDPQQPILIGGLDAEGGGDAQITAVVAPMKDPEKPAKAKKEQD